MTFDFFDFWMFLLLFVVHNCRNEEINVTKSDFFYQHFFICSPKLCINPFLTRFFAITSPIKTVFFDNSVTLKTVLICVYRTNWMCLTKTSVVQ